MGRQCRKIKDVNLASILKYGDKNNEVPMIDIPLIEKENKNINVNIDIIIPSKQKILLNEDILKKKQQRKIIRGRAKILKRKQREQRKREKKRKNNIKYHPLDLKSVMCKCNCDIITKPGNKFIAEHDKTIFEELTEREQQDIINGNIFLKKVECGYKYFSSNTKIYKKTIYYKYCSQCKNIFRSKNEGKRFCSDKCIKEHKEEIDKKERYEEKRKWFLEIHTIDEIFIRYCPECGAGMCTLKKDKQGSKRKFCTQSCASKNTKYKNNPYGFPCIGKIEPIFGNTVINEVKELKYTTQKPIEGKHPFIVYHADFFITSYKGIKINTVLECDEPHHFEEPQKTKDIKRDRIIKEVHGYDTIRFADIDIKNKPEECIQRITNYCERKIA